jgi:hypothetical protein
VKIGELEIPADYWSLNPNYKRELCLTIIDAILTLLDKQVSPELNRIVVLEKLLESSIITNAEDENYEICQVLTDIKNILNEPTD